MSRLYIYYKELSETLRRRCARLGAQATELDKKAYRHALSRKGVFHRQARRNKKRISILKAQGRPEQQYLEALAETLAQQERPTPKS